MNFARISPHVGAPSCPCPRKRSGYMRPPTLMEMAFAGAIGVSIESAMIAPQRPGNAHNRNPPNSDAADCAGPKRIWGVSRDGSCFSVPEYFFLWATRQVGGLERQPHRMNDSLTGQRLKLVRRQRRSYVMNPTQNLGEFTPCSFYM
jgi:hypothetical protein